MFGNKLKFDLPLLALLFIASVSLNAPAFAPHGRLDEQIIHLPTPAVASQISLGYSNLLSAIYWIETISYYGERTDKSDFHTLARFLKLVTTLNPKAEHAYYMAAVVLPWNTGSIRDSDPLLAKAMKTFPNDWRWPYYRGFNAYWFQHDIKTASHYLQIASSKPSSPSIITNLALRMQSQGGDLDTALAFLDNLLSKKSDKHIQKQLLQQRNAVLTEKVLRQIDSLLAKLPIRHYDIRDLDALRKIGVKLPVRLPDGGKLRFNRDHELVSSASSKRFRVFVPPRRKVRTP